jgi:hypothetical protein
MAAVHPQGLPGGAPAHGSIETVDLEGGAVGRCALPLSVVEWCLCKGCTMLWQPLQGGPPFGSVTGGGMQGCRRHTVAGDQTKLLRCCVTILLCGHPLHRRHVAPPRAHRVPKERICTTPPPPQPFGPLLWLAAPHGHPPPPPFPLAHSPGCDPAPSLIAAQEPIQGSPGARGTRWMSRHRWCPQAGWTPPTRTSPA